MGVAGAWGTVVEAPSVERSAAARVAGAGVGIGRAGAGLGTADTSDSAGDRELLADADHAVWAGDRIPVVPG